MKSRALLLAVTISLPAWAEPVYLECRHSPESERVLELIVDEDEQQVSERMKKYSHPPTAFDATFSGNTVYWESPSINNTLDRETLVYTCEHVLRDEPDSVSSTHTQQCQVVDGGDKEL